MKETNPAKEVPIPSRMNACILESITFIIASKCVSYLAITQLSHPTQLKQINSKHLSPCFFLSQC